MSDPIKNAIEAPVILFEDGLPLPTKLTSTSQEGLYSDSVGDLYIPVGADKDGRRLISPYRLLDKSYEAADIRYVEPSDSMPLVVDPKTGEEVSISPGISVSIDQKTGAVQINIPDYQLSQLHQWAEKEGISFQELPNMLFQMVKGEVFNPETKEWMTPKEVRDWGYKRVFKGNLDEKTIDYTANHSKGKVWYSENRPQILDNFKNNFKAHGGAFNLSIFSLMGMGELADVAEIEDPSLRLAFVLGPLPAVERVSHYIIAALRGPRNVLIKGYRSESGIFRPNIFLGPILEV